MICEYLEENELGRMQGLSKTFYDEIVPNAMNHRKICPKIGLFNIIIKKIDYKSEHIQTILSDFSKKPEGIKVPK